MYVYVFSCMSLCTVHGFRWTLQRPKKVLYLMERYLLIVGNCHGGSGNPNRVLQITVTKLSPQSAKFILQSKSYWIIYLQYLDKLLWLIDHKKIKLINFFLLHSSYSRIGYYLVSLWSKLSVSLLNKWM